MLHKIFFTVVFLMITKISFAGSIIDRFDGKTFFRSATSIDCALHFEKISDTEISSMGVLSIEMNRYFEQSGVRLEWCNGNTLVRTCDSKGRCTVEGDDEPSLWLLPDGNILSYRSNGETYKFYPSSSRQYFWF